MQKIECPISIGELFDKISILEIKLEKIMDSKKRVNIERELALLLTKQQLILPVERVSFHRSEMKKINNILWTIEDEIRECEEQKNFGQRFVELARAVYINNDLRFKIKSAINLEFNSEIVEEKSYKEY